jgi:hypothetical protein
MPKGISSSIRNGNLHGDAKCLVLHFGLFGLGITFIPSYRELYSYLILYSIRGSPSL